MKGNNRALIHPFDLTEPHYRPISIIIKDILFKDISVYNGNQIFGSVATFIDHVHAENIKFINTVSEGL